MINFFWSGIRRKKYKIKYLQYGGGTSESNKSLEYTVQNTFLGQIQSYTKC